MGKQRYKQIEALKRAVFWGEKQQFSEIIATGIELDQELTDSLLEQAICSSFAPEPIVKLLLEYGADPNYLNQSIYRNDSKVIKVLLDYKAEVDRRNKNGSTPLIYATTTGKEEIALILIEAGADIRAVNILGLMPVHGAIIHDLQRVIKIFKKRGVSTNIIDLKLDLSVSIEDLNGAVVITEEISEENEIIISFFALDAEQQLEIVPILDRKYLYNFSGGDVLTDRSLCVLVNEYLDCLNHIHCLFDADLHLKIEAAVDTIQTIINYLPEGDNFALAKEFSSPKWLLVRWLSQYLKDYLYIDQIIDKQDIEKIISYCLHP